MYYSFALLDFESIFLITWNISMLFTTSSTWAFFNVIVFVFKSLKSKALIKFCVTKLKIWVKQKIEHCVLFHRKSRRFIVFFNSSLRVKLWLTLSITTSKSFVLMSKRFNIFINSFNKWESICEMSKDANSMRCSRYWKLSSTQYIITFKNATFCEFV